MERYQNIYQSAREGAGLTQEKAAEMLGWSVRNLQAIEQEDRTPTPVRVAEMAEAYRAPWLRGYYCNRCPLGTLWRRPESNVELQQLAYTIATATPDKGHLCNLHHSAQLHQILNPESEARD